MAKQLKALRCVQVVQDGSDGVNVTFDVEHFDKVGELMKPRKRRHLSEKQKAANIERLAKYRFRSARQSDGEAQICDPGGNGE